VFIRARKPSHLVLFSPSEEGFLARRKQHEMGRLPRSDEHGLNGFYGSLGCKKRAWLSTGQLTFCLKKKG